MNQSFEAEFVILSEAEGERSVDSFPAKQRGNPDLRNFEAGRPGYNRGDAITDFSTALRLGRNDGPVFLGGFYYLCPRSHIKCSPRHNPLDFPGVTRPELWLANEQFKKGILLAWWNKSSSGNERPSESAGLRRKVEAERRRLEQEEAEQPRREAERARLAALEKERAEEEQRRLEIAWLHYMLRTSLHVKSSTTTSPVLVDGLWLGVRLYTSRMPEGESSYFVDLSSYSICPNCIKLRVAKILGTANPASWNELATPGNRLINKPYNQAHFKTDYAGGEGITRLAEYMRDLKSRRCKVFDRPCDSCGHHV